MTTQAPAVEPPAREGVFGVLQDRWDSIKSGDVGSWPVVLGLIAIVAFFTQKNSNFFTAVNFDNLIV